MKLLVIAFLFNGLIHTVSAQNIRAKKSDLTFPKEIYADIKESVFKSYLGPLSKSKAKGTMFIRFKIGKQGITEVLTTNPYPEILDEAFKKALPGLNQKWLPALLKIRSKELYILPVYFDFQDKAPSEMKKLGDILALLPDTLKYDRLPAERTFDPLFSRDNVDDRLFYGGKCILMPPLEIRYYVLE